MRVVDDRFELERLAGSGAMGEVHRARDRATDTVVAVKLLGPSAGDRQTARFVRESKLLAAVRHEAIVRYVAHGYHDGQPYLAMEWLEGIDLATHLKDNHVGVEEAIALVARVAEGLGLAHALGVVHRDIKPSNLFLEGGRIDRVKVIDFGVARAGGQTSLTATGVMVGTPHYMSPEQARGLSDVEPAADVYALAVLLFVCLAGRPPFLAEDLLAVLVRIVLEPPPRLSSLVPGLDRRVDDLVDQMLSKDPDARPPDGTALAAEIAALGPIQPPKTPLPRRRRAATLTGLEQRLLGVLLAGSAERTTDGTEILEPERAVLDLVRRAIAPHGATAEALADGSVVATLEGRGAATDLAVRAARSALALRAVLPDAPIALATGLSDASTGFPVGALLDRALALHTSSAEIHVDPVTAGLLDARFEVTSSPTSGGDVKVLVRELAHGEDSTDDEPRPGGPVRTLLGRETPCVGRDRELATLEAYFEECVREPRARPVILSGPAGIGKTRVGYEFLRRARLREPSTAVWIARGDPTSAGSPLGMLGQLVRRAAGIFDGEAIEVKRAKLVACVAALLHGPTARDVTDFLGELASVPFDDGRIRIRAARAEPRLMADQLSAVFTEFLLAASAKTPVLIVLEDLHWGDRPTVAFLDAALVAAADQPCMVVAFARPDLADLFPDLWVHRGVEVLRLGPLGKRAAEKLVRSVLGEDRAGVDKLVERAAGNAFFLEELIRSAADGAGDEVPGTVLAMISARLLALEPETRLLLRAASVFGQSFWAGGVVALMGRGEGEGEGEAAARVGHVLDDLMGRELVARRHDSRFGDAQEFAFRHGLVRDAAYETLTGPDRSLGHRLAAAWLEAAGETNALTLADHLERGDDPSGAAERYLATLVDALEANDLEAAQERAEHAAQLAIIAGRSDLVGRIRAAQAMALVWSGRFVDAAANADAAMLALGDDDEAWAQAADAAIIASARFGNFDRTAEIATEVLTRLAAAPARAEAPSDVEDPVTAAPTGQGDTLARAGCRAVVMLCSAGRYDLADALLAELDLARAGAGAARAIYQHARATRSLFAGDLGAYLEANERALALHEEVGDVRQACSQRVSVGFAANQLGEYERAELVLRGCVADAERLRLGPLVAAARSNLGVALARRGQLAEAEIVETRAAESFEGTGDRTQEGACRIYLAETLAIGGKLEAAEQEILAALDLLSDAPPLRCRALATRSRILLAKGEPDAALADARAASELLEVLGTLAEGEAVVGLALASALLSVGDVHAARVAGEAAERHLLARARKINDVAHREAFLSRVAEHVDTLDLAARLGASGS